MRAHCAGWAVALTWLLVAAAPADAAGCTFEPQGEGRVAAVIDARTLSPDGRPRGPPRRHRAGRRRTRPSRTAALAAIVAGREVTLSGEDDTPDRYGRQPAFVFLDGSDTPVQGLLLAQGEALVSGRRRRQGLRRDPVAAEAEARRARRGTWADPAAIKNAESPGDILAGIGRFTVVEGKVLSVRQAGATTYLNFGRNWTRDFAVTISRRMMPAFEAAGIAP